MVAINYDYKVKNKGLINRPTESEALELIDYKSQIENTILILQTKIDIIDEVLKALPDLHREFITRKLIHDLPYYKVCGELHISERYARKIKKRAINRMEKIINELESQE